MVPPGRGHDVFNTFVIVLIMKGQILERTPERTFTQRRADYSVITVPLFPVVLPHSPCLRHKYLFIVTGLIVVDRPY